ncbi:oxalocrotonate tautomerase [Penicillium cf. griseofulvum]|uniref:Oxalocrotonate tautomerase n=1 Tax=Penicillium cf. griseofulvum TaxID=2972120 RepID=A0A9W9N1E7_9EURO|nr:oxalocrotonate tautomerase [Penicillium cf. griseofulvum]KAJ5422665.1 oxalocrotonate tautomerase [Penicillium cf. griseofulvum]KAJ5428841.1 oxalocrotonate tautomerase [Penicillium cf. griseofulvum]
MPDWRIYHPTGTFTDPDHKEQLSKAITSIYTHVIPAFYVVVLFIEMPAGTMYRSGVSCEAKEGKKPFIRATFSHIARHFPPGESPERTRFMNAAHSAIKPFIADKGYDWEVNGEELERAFVHINGLRIPPSESEDEKRWMSDNEPSPWGPYLQN